MLLYNECLEEEPIYIPRKFLNDNTFTMNEQEKDIYFKLDLTKLKREMEILTTRRQYFRKKLNEIDQEFTAFIESESVSEVVKKNLEEEWVKHTTENNAQDNAVWQKSIKGKKEAFQRDKAQKNSHIGCHNIDNSLRTKERDGINRYNNSDTNREHDPHPRYQPRNPKNPYNLCNKYRRRPYH